MDPSYSHNNYQPAANLISPIPSPHTFPSPLNILKQAPDIVFFPKVFYYVSLKEKALPIKI